MSVNPILALMPESKYTWTLDHNLQPYIAQLPFDQATNTPVAISSDEKAVTCCAAKDGNVWVLYDSVAEDNLSILRKFDPATGEQIGSDITVNPLLETGGGGPLVRIGDLGSYKSLMEIDCGQILSVDRNTRELVIVKVASVNDELTPGVGTKSFPLSSLTSSGLTASASKIAHGIPLGSATITIEGADQTEYNGTYACTVDSADTFTYTFAGSGTATATGFITATLAQVNDVEIGTVVKRLKLSVTPFDGAVNAAGTRLLYLEDACAKLYDLVNDEFIRIIVANIPCFGDGSDGSGVGGGGGAAAPCSSTTGPPTGPQWFLDLLTGAGATNCWSATIMAAIEGSLNGMGFYLQRHSPPDCGIRGRMYYDPGGAVTSGCGFLDATHFSKYVDTTRHDGGWQFVANF